MASRQVHISRERAKEIMESIPVKVEAEQGLTEEQRRSMDATVRTFAGVSGNNPPIPMSADQLSGLFERLTSGMNNAQKRDVEGIFRSYWPDFSRG